ncbi:MAG: PAS domain S-box protein [Gemmatimonadetes bacterium]|nr:PAS domain S-box protein [Gemmatimonadota bacterium]
MDAELLQQQIRLTRERLLALREQQVPLGAAAVPIITALIDELAGALQELQETEEELLAQNEALSAARLEAELERQRYRDLFELAPDGYIVTDADGTILETNRAAVELLGVPAESLIGQPIQQFVAREDRREVRRRFRRVVAGERMEEWTGRVAAPGRPPVPVAVTAAMVRTADAPVEFRWMLRDVTLRERAAESARGLIREHAARLEAESEARRAEFLANASRVLGGTLDPSAVVQGLVELAASLAEYAAVYLVEGGRPRLVGSAGHIQGERASPSDSAAVRRALQRAMETAAPQLIPARSRPPKDAAATDFVDAVREGIPRRGVVAPLVTRGEVIGALVLLAGKPRFQGRDILLAAELADRAALALDNARHYQAAQAASRAKSEFLGIISHELRTPLTTVIGYADLLLGGIPVELPELARTYVERIRLSAWHQQALVEQILSYRRLEEAKEPVTLEPVAIDAVVSEVATLIEPAATRAGLTFRVELPTRIAPIHTDRAKLRQILLNLLTNAVKYTERGQVTLSLRVEHGWALFEVRDTGIGIAPEHLEQVFEPFWQVDSADTRRAGGSGLGLSVARRLARLLRGDVHVRSELGAGSTFELRLPAT